MRYIENTASYNLLKLNKFYLDKTLTDRKIVISNISRFVKADNQKPVDLCHNV